MLFFPTFMQKYFHMGFWDRFFWGKRPSYERDYQGNDSYYIEGNQPYSRKRKNLQYAQEHPILTPALLFVSNLFAQGRFRAVNKATKEEIPNHPWMKLLDNPNFYQTRIDFLESLQFLKMAQGRAIIWLKRPVGFSTPEEMYLLRDDLIMWPEGFTTDLLFRENLTKMGETILMYDQNGLRLEVKLKDLLFLYDLPNVGSTTSYAEVGGSYNLYDNTSRLDGLEQTLLNTYDSLIAKNTILQSNGKEMLKANANANGQAPFTPEQITEAKKMFNTGYGLGKARSRAFITSSDVNWQSLHVALRDLGLDESVKTDGNIIYTALHIPKDIISLEAKKTTYNNFKESMTSYIQNDIQAMANDLAQTLWQAIDDDSIEIIGDYEHLPVMQFALLQHYEAKISQAKALNDLLATGVPEEDALQMVGLPRNMKLNERQSINVAQGGQSSTAASATAEDQSKEIREDNFRQGEKGGLRKIN